MYFLRCILLLSALLLLASRMQGQEFILAPPESQFYSLPSSIAIQAAAQIDSTVLAVWGTTVRISDSAGIPQQRPALVWQRVQNNAAQGSPQFIADSTARPDEWVTVSAVDNFFVVLWCDRSGIDTSDAVLLRGISIDTAGNVLGPIWTLDTIPTSGQVTVARAAGTRLGMRVIWSVYTGDSTRTFWSWRQANGTRNEATEQLIAWQGLQWPSIAVQHYPTLPGATFVRLTGIERFLYADGRVDTRPTTVIVGMQVSPDTSMIAAVGPGIGIYRSFFQRDADTVITVPLDPKVPAGEGEKRVAGRDSNGRFWLKRYLYTSDRNDYGSELSITSSKSQEDSTGRWVVLSPAILYLGGSDGIQGPGGLWSSTQFYFDNASLFLDVCGNSVRPTFTCNARELSNSYMHQPTTFIGPIRRVFDDFDRTDAYINPQYSHGTCIAPIGVARYAGSNASSIITIGSKTLSTPTALLPTTPAFTKPGFQIIRDSLYWTGLLPGSVMAVSAWPNGSASARQERYSSSLALATLTFSNYINKLNGFGTGQFTTNVVNHSEQGATGVSYFTRGYRSVDDYPFSYDYTESRSVFLVAIPGIAGLQIPYRVQMEREYPDSREDNGSTRAWTHNPLKSISAVALTSSIDGEAVVVVTPTQSTVAHPGVIIPKTCFAALDSTQIFGGTRDSGFIYRMSPGSVPATVESGWKWREDAHWRQVQADVRPGVISAAADTITRTLLVRRYEPDGTSIDSLSLSFPTSLRNLTLCICPSDSSVSLVYERQGIRITRLNGRLGLVSFDSLVSSAADSVSEPQALWWRDTLHVIWQDNHKVLSGIAGRKSEDRALQYTVTQGYGTIRGCALSLPKVLNGTGDSGVDGAIGSQQRIRTLLHLVPSVPLSPPGDYLLVSPQPARNQVRVDFLLLTDPARKLMLVDMLGRVVMERAIEGYPRRGTLELDCTGLPAGSYMLVLYSPAHVTTVPLILE